ncbi:MAG: cytochrome P450 [Streptosporangiales bacterium]|nr:cytochrome P450 [Streptosporangiales bacterium]
MASPRVEIDFDVYNPFDPEFVKDPFEHFARLTRDYPVAFHKGINGWLVTTHELAAEVLKSPRFSSRFKDWNDAPPEKPREEWTIYEKVMDRSLLAVEPKDHMRLRRLTAPAFSRKVMDQIEVKIAETITQIFDEIDNPAEFNAAADIAAKVPIRSIARMVGVPPKDDTLFEHGLGWNMVRAANPLHADQRDQLIADAIPALEYLQNMIAERRARKDPGDDFIGTLISTTEDGEGLDDFDILSVVVALVVAGADTAVDLHTTALHALLTHPEQHRLLRQRPELTEDAIIEVLRWSGFGKFGGIPRFPYADTEFGGQVLGKGEFVMPILSAAFLDPAKWPEPRTFDITRNHAGNLIFGAGPHLCIGLNLVKAQGKLMITEFDRRFGDTAGIVGDIGYDPAHFNARRMTTLTVRTTPGKETHV